MLLFKLSDILIIILVIVGSVSPNSKNIFLNMGIILSIKNIKTLIPIISKTNAMNDSTHMEINDKNICDVVEASIAAFYLINKDIKDSYWFIKECNIDDDLKANASEETFKRIQDFYYDFGEIGEEDYKIIQRDISFIEIATQYKIGIYGWDIDNFQKDFSHLESLINYKFNFSRFFV